MSSVRKLSAAVACALVLAFLLPSGGAAQSTATVRGRVVAASAMRPMAGVQVVVEGTGRGALTNSSGDFLIVGVPAGTHTVRAQMLGYATAARSISVAAGQTAVLDFELGESAIALDEVVITGTPGATKRRALGTSLASIDVEEELADAPITGVADLLTGREAGVVSLGNSGTVGTATNITLRGMSSLSQSNEPLIYVDGIRLDISRNSLVGSGGQQTSRLGDINPDDISRVEIIKGAAATTLYGSEASNGVIQIFTKRGRSGEIQLQAGVKTGFNRLPAAWPKMHPDPQYPDPNEELIKNGLYQEYNLSLRGGAERLTYYISGSMLDNEGSFPNNRFQRGSGRLNLGIAPTDNLTVEFSTNIVWSNTTLPVNDNSISGILTNIQIGNPVTRATETDPWGGAFYPVPYVMQLTREEETNRVVGGLTFNHNLSDAVTQRLTFGMDLANGEGVSMSPYADGLFVTNRQLLGDRTVRRRSNVQTNIDYAGTWTLALPRSIESQFSVGAQLFSTTERRIRASGSEFAAPGLAIVDATAIPSVEEDEVSYATGGLFVQEQIGFGDRFFLTGGLRVDGSSVFGDDFGLQPYPKVSASYVISEEPWFRLPGVSSLKLRAGYGTAGTQPGAFDAVRTYTPTTAFEGKTAIRQDNMGNPDLAPEVSHEIEGGFDAGLFGDRLSLIGTAYHQTTQDALLRRKMAPSLGFTATQLQNVGEVVNRGLELTAHAALVQRPGFEWNVTASYAYNDNEVTHLPDVDYIAIDRFGTRITQGYAMSSKWERVVVGTDADGMPIASDTAVYLGPGVPPHNGSFATEVVWRDLRVNVNTQWARGHIVSNLLRPYMYARATGEEWWNEVMANGNDPKALPIRAKMRQASCCYGSWYEEGDWLKLREVTLAYTVPQALTASVFSSRPRVFVSGRNLYTLTGYSGVDPELSSDNTYFEGTGHSVSSDYFTVPQSMQFLLGIDVSF